MIYHVHFAEGIQCNLSDYSYETALSVLHNLIALEELKEHHRMLVPRNEPYKIAPRFIAENEQFSFCEVVPLMDGSGVFQLTPAVLELRGRLYIPRLLVEKRQEIFLPEEQDLAVVMTAAVPTGKMKISDLIYYDSAPIASPKYPFSLS